MLYTSGVGVITAEAIVIIRIAYLLVFVRVSTFKIPFLFRARRATGISKVIPKAKIIAASSHNLNDLPLKVTMKDYADLHSPNGVTVKYFYSGTEKIQGIIPIQGQIISSYNDGMFDLLPSDSVKDVWFEQGEGRLVMDLQNSLSIDSIHVFSTLDTKRGPQVFSLWTSDKKDQLSLTGDPKAGGWTYIARSSPPDIDDNAKIVYTIIPNKETPLSCRYLLWISEESGHGPYYFREIDVFEKQK